MVNRKRSRRPADRDLSVKVKLDRVADALTKDADSNVAARVASRNDQVAASLRELANRHREEE